jgi:membrane-associated HD superfamily phosphohydrolase
MAFNLDIGVLIGLLSLVFAYLSINTKQESEYSLRLLFLFISLAFSLLGTMAINEMSDVAAMSTMGGTYYVALMWILVFVVAFFFIQFLRSVLADFQNTNTEEAKIQGNYKVR